MNETSPLYLVQLYQQVQQSNKQKYGLFDLSQLSQNLMSMNYAKAPVNHGYQMKQTGPNSHYQNENDSYKTDEQYFENLEYYTPFCWCGEGSPIFLINKGWYTGLICLVIANAVFILGFVTFLNSSSQGLKPVGQADKNRIIAMNIAVIAFINITFFLTQFLNPGIRNLSSISQEEYQQHGRFYCVRCNGDRTGQMEHCSDCKVCVQGLDHHCGFFSKCIAGCQKFAFYAFLASVFIGFLCMLITLSSNL